MDDLDDPEIRFARALVSFLKNFNLLEENVGLCLAHLIRPGKSEAYYPQLAKMTAERKMEKLRELLMNGEVIQDGKSAREFKDWYELADRARSIRNRYVHGYWEYLPLRGNEPVDFRAPAWMREKLGDKGVETMSLAAFEAIAFEMKEVQERFSRIRRKHGV